MLRYVCRPFRFPRRTGIPLNQIIMDSRSAKIGFLFLCVVFLLINGTTLYNGHDWGDDFAQYIRHAQNLLEAKPYASRIMLDPGVVSPPGFPLLLVPLLKIFGLNFIALKIWNIVFWMIFVVAIYRLYQMRLSEEEALLGAAVWFLFPFFFMFKQSILTDIPFLGMAMTAVVLFEIYLQQKERTFQSGFFLGWSLVAMTAAMMTRWFGMLLFVAALLVSGISGKKRRDLWIIFGVLFLNGLVQWIWGVSFMSHLKEASFPLRDWPMILQDNIRNNFVELSILFFPFKMNWSDWVFSWIDPWSIWLGLAVAGYLVVVLIVRLKRRTLTMSDAFLTLGYLSILFWPVSSAGRYPLPLIGLLLLEGLKLLRRFPLRRGYRHMSLGIPLLIVLIFLNVSSLAIHFDFNSDAIHQPQSLQLFEWIRNSTRPSERFMFGKPRALCLLTDRPSAAYTLATDPRSCVERIRDLKIDYLVFLRDTGELSELHLYNTLMPLAEQSQPYLLTVSAGDEKILEGIVRAGVKVRRVWENSTYAVFRVEAKSG